MPGITPEARAEFRKITGYQKMIDDNVEEATFRKSITDRLINLKQEIDDLTPEEKVALTPSSPEITEFGRLSTHFVSGDDIANIDNLYKQALNEKDYVKRDLLEGDFGCEKEMRQLWASDPLSYSKYARRQAYPYLIDHLYAWYGLENPTGGGPFDVPYNPTMVAGMRAPMSSCPTQYCDPDNGFLYGAVYYNAHAGPWGLGTGLGTSSANPCQEYIGVVWFSLPNDDNESGTADISGLSPGGACVDGSCWDPNNCGVVTRGFEKVFGVY